MADQQATQAEARVEARAEEQTTVYNIWQRADGLHEGEEGPKWITFKNGFVRVRKGDRVTVQEGWAGGEEKSFYVPPWHSCEVLGNPDIKFTKA
jgi:hypothetical protein